MKKMMLALALLLGAAPVRAAGTGCQDTSTGTITLEKIRSNAQGTQIAGCINRSFDIIAASMAASFVSTPTAFNFGTIYVNRIGGRSAGSPDIRISSGLYTDAGTYFTHNGTAAISAALYTTSSTPRVGVNISSPVYALDVNGESVLRGQTVVGSSLTVQGSEGVRASSGNFTGTGASVYSITSSSGLHLLNGRTKLESGAFIEWADGTTSTTSSSGSTGSAGHTIASGTVSGGAALIISGTLAAQTTLYFDADAFEVFDDASGDATIVKAKGGAGFASPSSTFTLVTSNQSTTSTVWTSISASTITLQMNGGHIVSGFSCPIDNNTAGSLVEVGMLVNGNFAYGVDGTRGLIHLQSPTNGRDSTAFTHMSSSTYSGSVSISLIWKVSANTGELDAASKARCEFYAYELRSVPGTGDVSSNSDNTFSGDNTFTSSVTVTGGIFGMTWNTWTPSFTGFSADPTVGTARFTQIGKLVVATVNDSGNGTSNATTYTITLPVAAKSTLTNVGFGGGVDNSAASGTCAVATSAGSSTAAVYKDQNSGAWTASGAKNCNFTVMYEAE